MNIAVLMMYNKLLTLFPGKYPVLPGKPLNKAGNAIIFLKKDAPFSMGIFFCPLDITAQLHSSLLQIPCIYNMYISE